MKKFFTSKLFIALIGILCLALIIWFVGPLVAIAGAVPLAGVVARLVTITVVALIWVIVTLVQRLRVQKANQQMVEEIFEQPGAATDSARAEEVAQLGERFRESITLLKKSDSESAGDLYSMPWYIIIGPPGAGKTTALVNSGLRFPLAERMGQHSLQGIGGTRNCDWWFTDEAVLIDTAGRYVTQDSSQQVDSGAWDGFLGLLKKYRKRRPINGAIVAISILDVMTQNPAERKQHASAIKARLAELKERLGMDVPVYVLLTKCDLVAGFSEFFEDMGNQEREQVWGMTFPLVDDPASFDYIGTFNSDYEQLIQRLNDRMLPRIQAERDQQRVAKIYGFPQQMATLQSSLSEFLGDVFAKSKFDEQHLLRGVYLCSGVQEGRPIDRVLGALSRSFGISASDSSVSGAQGRSYFLTQLFSDVIFAEKSIAAVNRKLELRRAWLQNMAYVATIAVLGLVAFAWSTSYTRNQLYLSDMEDRVDDFEQSDADVRRARNPDESVLAPAVDNLIAVRDTFAPVNEDVPWLMGMGLYQGGKLTRSADGALKRYLTVNMMPQVQDRLEDIIRRSSDEPGLLYESLKVYLMLEDPEKLQKENLDFWMNFAWAREYGSEDETTASMMSGLDNLYSLGIDPITTDERLVRRSQRNLASVNETELHYLVFKNSLVDAPDSPQVSVEQLASFDASSVFSRRSGKSLEEGIPLLYTIDGKEQFEEDYVDAILDTVTNEAWVLGEQSRAQDLDKDELESRLLGYYYDDYIDYWEDLLFDLEMRPFSGLRESIDIMKLVSGNRSPIKKMLTSLEGNTNLFSESMLDKAKSGSLEKLKQSRLQKLLGSSSQLDQVESKAKPEDVVTNHFEEINQVVQRGDAGPAPIDNILTQFSEYYASLVDLRDARGAAKISVDQSSLVRRIRTEAARQPEPLQSWMNQLLSENKRVVYSTAGGALKDMYASSVGPACDRAIKNRFPVYRNASQQITVADFSQFFGHGGVMDSFFNQNLANFVDKNRSGWSWRPEARGSIGLSDAVLKQFENADKIKQAFFPMGGQQLQVRFGLKPTYLDSNVRQVLIDFGDDNLRYRHGPARVTWFTWPNETSANGFSVTFDDASGGRKVYREQGEWALFNILRKSEVANKSSDRLEVNFEFEDRRASFELSASSVVNPFNLPALRRFSCNAGI